MVIFIIILPFLVLPFFFSYLTKQYKWRKKPTYFIIGLFVPIWPLILVQLKVLPAEGTVLAGTSVFAIPAVLFIQYLAHRIIYS